MIGVVDCRKARRVLERIVEVTKQSIEATLENGTTAHLNFNVGSSSLRAKLDAVLEEFGFRNTTDGMRTVIRDLVAGRIQYRDGILQSQGESCPN